MCLLALVTDPSTLIGGGAGAQRCAQRRKNTRELPPADVLFTRNAAAECPTRIENQLEYASEAKPLFTRSPLIPPKRLACRLADRGMIWIDGNDPDVQELGISFDEFLER